MSIKKDVVFRPGQVVHMSIDLHCHSCENKHRYMVCRMKMLSDGGCSQHSAFDTYGHLLSEIASVISSGKITKRGKHSVEGETV